MFQNLEMKPRVERNRLKECFVFFQALGYSPLAWFLAPLALWAGQFPVFKDVTTQSGIRFVCNGSPTAEKYLIETMVGGVAMFDYDGDGWPDLFFVNGAKLESPQPRDKVPDKSDPRFWNRLYHNNRDGTFTDVTEKAGLEGHHFGQGVAIGDYDNDGHPDIYVTNFGQNILYHNNGDGTFTDVTKKAGVQAGGWSSSAVFFDYDRDGWLDLLVVRYLVWDFDLNPYCGLRKEGFRAYCHPNQFKPATYILYHNNHDGTFTDVSKEAGFLNAPGNGLGCAVNDYDRDGWPDVFVANDAYPEQLFRNHGNGKFSDEALAAGVAYNDNGRTFSGMGVDFEDYDNDGWPDLFVDALANERYGLFHNRNGVFDYISDKAGVGGISMLHSGWGTKFADFDNDGWQDLFVAQGHVMDTVELTNPGLKYKERLLMMTNKKTRFEDVSAQCGEPFQQSFAARGAAFGDLYNNGNIDIAINILNAPAVVLRNGGGTGNHWLTVNTVGTVSNSDGIGAKVRIAGQSGLAQHGYVSTGGSYFSANDKRVHFGLGEDKVVKLLEIIWPSGIVQRLENVAADQILTVKEPSRARQ
jgi:hypothetical protein